MLDGRGSTTVANDAGARITFEWKAGALFAIPAVSLAFFLLWLDRQIGAGQEVERGVGALVDANMNEESTRLQALQVQQQLGIQALSIANGNAQQILSLFR